VIAGSALVCGCLLISACGGGAPASTAAPAELPAARPANGVAGSAPYAAANGGVGFGQAAGSSGAVKSAGQRAVQTAHLAPQSQSIIYTASLTVMSANARTTAKKAIGIVVGVGGYTSNEHLVVGSSQHSAGTVSLTLKVPVASYQAVLNELSSPSLGKQIALRQLATDVTQEVANVNSLVSSQQAAITALEGLLRHAATVSQLLEVQQQISVYESSLQSLLAQQRALNHETTYATISMMLLSTQHVAPRRHVMHAKHGFLAGLAAGWRGLRHATTWVLTVLGAALPFLIIALILAAAGYVGVRRFGRRRAGPTTVE